MKKVLIYTKKDSDEIIPFPSKELEKLITDKYDFEIGYLSEGYKAIFLLVKENIEDSRNDIWKVIFFNKVSIANAGTITLDNLDSLNMEQSKEEKYEVIKEIEGHFEQIIETAVEIINKQIKE